MVSFCWAFLDTIRESSPLCMDDGRDSIRSRSPLSPRIVNPSVANGQKEDAAQRTEHPRLGIEMAEIDKGPELGVEAQTLLPLETTVRAEIMCLFQERQGIE